MAAGSLMALEASLECAACGDGLLNRGRQSGIKGELADAAHRGEAAQHRRPALPSSILAVRHLCHAYHNPRLV
jgi:hypothetical protein